MAAALLVGFWVPVGILVLTGSLWLCFFLPQQFWPRTLGKLAFLTELGLLATFFNSWLQAERQRWCRRRDKLRAWAETHQASSRKRILPVAPAFAPMLVLTVENDEAGRWLRFLRFATGLFLRVSVPFSRSYVPLVRASCFLLALMIGVLVLYAATSHSDGHHWKQTLLNVTGLLMVVVWTVTGFVGLLLVSLHLMTIAAQRTLRAHRFGFGSETLLDNWLSDIAVRQIPQYAATVTHTPTLVDRGFRHSSFYQEPEVRTEIASWMHKAAAAHHPGPP